jgi:hypothetical protein
VVDIAMHAMGALLVDGGSVPTVLVVLVVLVAGVDATIADLLLLMMFSLKVVWSAYGM